jgi:predicted GNAT family acetyltransferase
MEVERFDEAREFRERADPLLLREEAANNLILGVTANVIDYPDRFEGFRGWVVIEDAAPIAAAAQTIPFQLILAVPESEDATTMLANDIDDIPGVVGCKPGVEVFIAERPEGSELTMAQGVFRLDSVIAPDPVTGSSRPARPSEAESLGAMWLEFELEALGEIDDARRTRESVIGRIEMQSTRLGLWVHVVDGEIVSLSGHSGPTPNGIRIGPVYTPPDLRGNGYATTLVARQSQWLLDNGHRYCFLYTDLANPRSNSIYQRIGYRQIAESAQYRFSQRS